MIQPRLPVMLVDWVSLLHDHLFCLVRKDTGASSVMWVIQAISQARLLSHAAGISAA